MISTLEALAMLIALKLKFGQEPDPDDMRVLIVPSITDNRGNGAALNKLMSTRFPSSAVLMELAAKGMQQGSRMFANGDTSLFVSALVTAGSVIAFSVIWGAFFIVWFGSDLDWRVQRVIAMFSSSELSSHQKAHPSFCRTHFPS